jgi:hypothetical protein
VEIEAEELERGREGEVLVHGARHRARRCHPFRCSSTPPLPSCASAQACGCGR